MWIIKILHKHYNLEKTNINFKKLANYWVIIFQHLNCFKVQPWQRRTHSNTVPTDKLNYVPFTHFTIFILRPKITAVKMKISFSFTDIRWISRTFYGTGATKSNSRALKGFVGTLTVIRPNHSTICPSLSASLTSIITENRLPHQKAASTLQT